MAVPKKARPRFGVLRTIALYKLVKVVLLLGVAYGELKLRDANLVERILAWAAARPEGVEHRLVSHAMEWFSGLSAGNVAKLRMVTLVYAAVFAVEGVGLWFEQRWAEWLTVIVTASLIPVEGWELLQHPNVRMLLIILGNVAIVAYLIWHVRSRNSGSHGVAAPGKKTPS
jgi:uncharacterized membrane protein (DUF2068 family)